MIPDRFRSFGLLITLFFILPAGAQRASKGGPNFAPDEVVVGLKDDISDADIAVLCARKGLTLIREFPQVNAGVMRLTQGQDVRRLCQDLKEIPGVRFAEPNYSRRILLDAPNDPAYNNLDTNIAPYEEDAEPTWFQWGLHSIQALEAWNIYPNTYYTSDTKPRDALKIAVIDTGIDDGGPDGEPQPDFINAGGSSIDARLGGQVDLADRQNVLAGYLPSDVTDDYGHGTAVAGVIAASANNGGDPPGDGIVGLAYPCQIMPIKAIDDTGQGTEADLTAGILWAVDHGALIINISAGDFFYSQLEQDAVNYAWENGSLIVAAAGNGSSSDPIYPAACEGVMGVAATCWPDGLPASYTSFGNHVRIAAPGGDISLVPLAFWGVWTTMPTEPVPLHYVGWEPEIWPYQYHFGTSLASPHVAALAGLYASSHGITQDTPGGVLQIWRALQRGCDDTGFTVGWHPYLGWGQINAYETLLDRNNRGSLFGCLTGQVMYYGTVVGNAVVEATPAGGGSSVGTTTHPDGTYRISNLDPGLYDVKVTYMDATDTLSDVLVERSMDTPRVNFLLPPAPPQPDLWIKYQGTWLGDDVYNGNGEGQTARQKKEVGQTARYKVRFYNDGDETETFFLKGPAGDDDWTVEYYKKSKKVTDLVTSTKGWKRVNVPPGGVRCFRIEVTPQSGLPSGSVLKLKVRAESKRDSTQRDVIKVVTKVR